MQIGVVRGAGERHDMRPGGLVVSQGELAVRDVALGLVTIRPVDRVPVGAVSKKCESTASSCPDRIAFGCALKLTITADLLCRGQSCSPGVGAWQTRIIGRGRSPYGRTQTSSCARLCRIYRGSQKVERAYHPMRAGPVFPAPEKLRREPPTTARAASRPSSRTPQAALLLLRDLALVTRARRERSTSNSSPWPPTGLADGFGPEKPYSRPAAQAGRAADSPPGISGSPALWPHQRLGGFAA